MIRLIFLSIISTAMLLMTPVFSFAVDSYTVANNATVTIDEYTVCKDVTNNTGTSIMVPTKTANEWHTGGSSFLENLPAGVTVAACSPSCSGYLYQGYCYHLAALGNTSCTSACFTYGGCIENGTRNITGPGNWAKCQNVASNVLGAPPMFQYNSSQVGSPVGCYYYPVGVWGDVLWRGVSSGCGAANGFAGASNNFCACNN